MLSSVVLMECENNISTMGSIGTSKEVRPLKLKSSEGGGNATIAGTMRK